MVWFSIFVFDAIFFANIFFEKIDKKEYLKLYGRLAKFCIDESFTGNYRSFFCSIFKLIVRYSRTINYLRVH